jgi:hypothetical protein
VRGHFPQAIFHRKDGAVATLEFDRLQLSEWAAPMLFKDVVNVQLEDAWMKKRLTLTHRQEGKAKPRRTRLYPQAFSSEKGDLLTMFDLYFGRHKTAEVLALPG